MTKQVLIVLTSHGNLGDTDRKTGFYVSEAARPWAAFTSAGYDVDLASPLGGEPPRDGEDVCDPVQRAFLADEQLNRTARLSEETPLATTRSCSPAATARCGTSPATPTSPGWPARSTRPAASWPRCATARPR